MKREPTDLLCHSRQLVETPLSLESNGLADRGPLDAEPEFAAPQQPSYMQMPMLALGDDPIGVRNSRIAVK